MAFKTIIEPFRIKSVEPLTLSTAEQRKAWIQQAGLNVFKLKSDHVLIDLLTDSGTGAMSTEQWAGIMRGDESYAGSPSYFRFEDTVKKITGLEHIIPTHQGRASERIMFQSICKSGTTVVSNLFFDTTRANAEAAGLKTIDIPCAELSHLSVPAPFKGNIDLTRLAETLKKGNVSLVVMTITNNSGGGQPVSLENLKAAKELASSFKVPFAIDACRFAENSWFIKIREKGYAHKTPLEIAQETFALADVITISAKKDGMANMGGVLAMRNAKWAEDCRNNLILTEGFPTYGGLSGRDLEAVAQGLWEALDEGYLQYRIRSTQYIGDKLTAAGVPIVLPTGGHAIYIDAKGFLPQIPPNQYPGQALVVGMYEHAGIRSCEIGSVMFGRPQPDGSEIPHLQELVRLAIPRRVYTQSHMDYVCEAIADFKHTEAPKLKGVKFTYQAPALRHFTASFAWI